MLFFFRFRQLFPIYLLVGGMGSADFLQCQHIHNDILRLGNARPTVACHVEGQGSGKMEVGRELFQVAVDAQCTVAVLLLLGAVLALDKRQEVWGGCGCLRICRGCAGCRARFGLASAPCLTAGVDDATLADVRLAQKGKVDGAIPHR